MKKILLFLVAAMLATVARASFGEHFTYENLDYRITSDEDRTVSVDYHNNAAGCVSIPYYVFFRSKLYSVTSIGKGAFRDCSGLTSVVIPGSVTSIADNAFRGCSGLSWLYFPENKAGTFIIGKEAFKGCSSLFSVMFLPRNSEIVYNAFNECNYLKKVAAYDSSLFEMGGAFFDVNSQWTIEDDDTVDAEKGIIWSADNTQCWLSGKYTGSLIMPDGMTQLEHWSRLVFRHSRARG